MCKYCEMGDTGLGKKNLIDSQHIDLGIIEGIEINSIIQDENVLSTYLMDECSDVLSEYNIKIKYCPMCGRKLKNEEEEG